MLILTIFLTCHKLSDIVSLGNARYIYYSKAFDQQARIIINMDRPHFEEACQQHHPPVPWVEPSGGQAEAKGRPKKSWRRTGYQFEFWSRIYVQTL